MLLTEALEHVTETTTPATARLPATCIHTGESQTKRTRVLTCTDVRRIEPGAQRPVRLHRPNYRNSLLRQGIDEDDLRDGGSARLVEQLVACGDPDAISARLRAHLDAGADHVLIQVLGGDDYADPMPALRRLAALATER